jgi:hypothetical protein
LLFIDGQADFFQPEAEPYGEAASMDLALVTGHGPTLLTEFEGKAPLIRDTDAVAFGLMRKTKPNTAASRCPKHCLHSTSPPYENGESPLPPEKPSRT